MATKKKQAFDIPFIGYDYGKDFNWDFDVLFGQYGNPIIGIKIKNMVEQYSADPDNYLIFHTILNQVVSIIGEGRIGWIQTFNATVRLDKIRINFLYHE